MSIKDPTNANVTNTISNLTLDFRDVRHDAHLLNASSLPHVLNEAVKAVAVDVGEVLHGSAGGDGRAWYDAYRCALHRYMQPAPHEFTRHSIACVIAVSTTEPDDCLRTLAQLNQTQNAIQHGSTTAASDQSPHTCPPRWFSANTLKYYVLVHDVAAGNDQM